MENLNNFFFLFLNIIKKIFWNFFLYNLFYNILYIYFNDNILYYVKVILISNKKWHHIFIFKLEFVDTYIYLYSDNYYIVLIISHYIALKRETFISLGSHVIYFIWCTSKMHLICILGYVFWIFIILLYINFLSLKTTRVYISIIR